MRHPELTLAALAARCFFRQNPAHFARLQTTDWVNFNYNDAITAFLYSSRIIFTGITIAVNDFLLSSNYEIRYAYKTIEKKLRQRSFVSSKASSISFLMVSKSH